MKFIIFIFLFISLINVKAQYVFDDFNYKSIEIASDRNSPMYSIFGFNYWKTNNDSILLKAWYRWNIAEPKLGKNSEIQITKDGISLNLHKGFTELSKSPVIHSSFAAKHGLFLSRIKFGAFNNNDLLTQAFWLFSPVWYTFDYNGKNFSYTSEIDFEFNNWWVEKYEPIMAVGSNMHNYLFNKTKFFRLNFFNQGQKIKHLGFADKYKNQNIFYEQWFIAVFSIDTINNITKFWLESDYDNFQNARCFLGNEINNVNEFKPFEITNYQPDYQMLTVYSQHPQNSVSQTNKMEIDWFFYSQNINLSIDSIKHIIYNFRKENISKVNTAKLHFYEHNESDKSIYSFIDGADTAYSSKENTWLINHPLIKFCAYFTKFKYRLHHKEYGWMDYVNIYSNRFSIKPICIYDSLELRIHFKDMWREIYEEKHKIIPIVCDTEYIINDIFISDFAYHPFSNTLMFNYHLPQKSKISVKIYDMNGLEFQTLLETELDIGYYNFERKMSELASGMYVVRIVINSNVYIRKFISFRH